MAETRKVEIVLANEKAVRALGVIASVLAEVKEDMPWRDDVKRAAAACRYALRHLRAQPMECRPCGVCSDVKVEIEGL